MWEVKPVTFGKPRRDYDTITSTQDIAREWVERDGLKATGGVVTARAMTAGRGRLGRTWHVPPGSNVCLTAIGPPVEAARTWQIALLGGVVVAHAINAVAGFFPRVRFPNDVYASGRKLAGILVETVPAWLPGQVVPLVGIGVNVNVAPDELPLELRDRATSVQAETGATKSVDVFTNAVLRFLSDEWSLWQTAGFHLVLEKWRKLADLDAFRAFILNGEEVSCRVISIELNGNVTLETPTGETVGVPAPQIIFGDD